MSAFSETDAEVVKLKIGNKLMNEEITRLQPELKKYENCAHPAARPVQINSVSTSSLAEKTKGIKKETSKLKVVENELSDLNDRVTSLFSDVETKVVERDNLFSEIEQATSMMKSLTTGSSQFEEDSGTVRKAAREKSNLLISKAINCQSIMKEGLSKLAVLKKNYSDLDRVVSVRQQRTKTTLDRKVDCEGKIHVVSLAEKKAQFGELIEKNANMNDYITSLTNDEGLKMESLRCTITECENLKQQKSDLAKELEAVKAREEIILTEKEEKARCVEESQRRLDELMAKKEQLLKDHALLITEMKDSYDPLVESLKTKKDSMLRNLEAMRKRIGNREECLKLRRELETEGSGEALDFTEEMKSLKQEFEDARANITKAMEKAEHHRSVEARFNEEVIELQVSIKRKREDMERKLHEKDGVANHFEMEVFNLKKKLEREKAERENRLALETRRLLEKAKEDKERKQKEEKRRIEKEKEKEKRRKTKEEEENKRKRAIEDQAKKEKEEREKKKQDEARNRMMDAVQNKDATSAILSRVQQRRMNMVSASSFPFSFNDGSLLNSSMDHTPSSGVTLRSRNVLKKSMLIFDEDSSEDDDDDMSDFLLDDFSRVMPKVPEKYASSPPRVEKKSTPLNPFELSFTDAQSSTPVRQKSLHSTIPTPALEISFNQVATSTPQIQRGSKTNKKQTRPRGGKKKTK